MTKEGIEPPQEVIATLLETIGDEKYPYPHGMSEHNYYMAGRLMEELKKLGWVPPTPPTPAGAGTEMPSREFSSDPHDHGMVPDKVDPFKFNSWRLRTNAEWVEVAEAARRQAEDYRATIAETEKYLASRKIMGLGDGVFAAVDQTVLEHITALRAQLATAEKDRERRQTP